MRRAIGLALVAVFVVSARGQTIPAHEDQWLVKPVNERTFQNYLEFFHYDDKLPFDVKMLTTERLNTGLTKEHLSFVSTPGITVTANLYRPVGAALETLPAIVLLHGGVPSGKDSLDGFATILARAGYEVLASDLQYFGERSSPEMMSTFTEMDKAGKLYNRPPTYLAWVTQTVKDASRSVDLLVKQFNADPRRIALIGYSRGAIVGTIVGAAEQRFRAVVLLYGGHFNIMEQEHFSAACPANYIAHISPRPLLMINGTRDTDMIKESSVEPLYRLAKMPKEILWANAGHQLPTEEHRAYMLQWLREKLKQPEH